MAPALCEHRLRRVKCGRAAVVSFVTVGASATARCDEHADAMRLKMARLLKNGVVREQNLVQPPRWRGAK